MKTKCPHCGQHYEVDDNAVGTVVDCESCRKNFAISKIQTGSSPNPKDTSKSFESNMQQKAKSPFDSEAMRGYAIMFRWARIIAAVVCVCAAIYQLYDILDDLSSSLRYEDSAIRAIMKNTKTLCELSKPIIYMLLAIFIKPDGENAK